MKNITTITVTRETKEELDLFIEYYAHIIAKVLKKSVRRIKYEDAIKFLLKNVKVNREIISKMRELEAQTAQAY